MKLHIKHILLTVFTVLAFGVSAQIHGGYDCATATVICNSISFTDTIQEDTIGEVFDFNQGETSCWGTRVEFHPLWYQFNVDKTGSLEFEITPNGNGFFNDWDFLLFDITDAGCGVGNWIEVACNADNTNGNTGLSAPLAGTPGFSDTIHLDSGRTYVLLINAIDFPFSGPLAFDLAVNTNGYPDAAGFQGLTPSFTINADTLCVGDILTTTNNSTGPGTLSYYWDFGNGVTTTATDTSVQYNTPGTYDVMLLVDNGVCPDTLIRTIFVADLTAAGDTTVCEGETVMLTATGGGTYLWNPGGMTTDTVFVSPSSTTTYTVTISNESCSSNETVTVTINPLPNITITENGSNPVCPNDSLELIANPGGMISYSWYFNSVLTGQTTQNIFVNTAGVYDVAVVDSFGCTDTSSAAVTVTLSTLPTVTNVSGGGVYCDGDAVTDVCVTVTGTGPWTINYTLDGVPQTANGNSSPVCLGNASGIYLVNGVTDANCTNTASGSDSIIINPLPEVTGINGGATYCVGDAVGNVCVDVTGTAPWTVTYTIDGGAPQVVVGNSSPICLGNGEGIYAVTTITDANCTNTASEVDSIIIHPLPTVTSVTGGAVYCQGDAVSDVCVTVTGTGSWTINYTLDGIPFTANGNSSPICLGNAPGVYAVTGVTDANCTNTASGTQTIIVNPLPTVTGISGGATYCIGDFVSDVCVDVTGTGPWTIDFTLDGVPQSVNGNTSPVCLGNAEGVYAVTGVTDVNCTNTANEIDSIVIHPLPTVTSVAGGGVYCAGDTVNQVCATVTGTGPWTVTYTLDGAGPFTANSNSSPVCLGSTAGIYVVTNVADANCTNTASGTQTIIVNPLPTVTNFNGGAVYCVGDAVNDVCVDVTGTGPWTIDFTLDGVPQTVNGNTSPICLGNAAGVYVLTDITDVNCTNTATGTQTITINPLPTVTSVTGGGIYCQGDAINDVCVAVTGTGPWTVTYTLDGAGPLTASGNSSPVCLGNAAGVYVVTNITDANCTNTASGTQTITINPLPTVTNFAGGGVYCFGDTINEVCVDVTGTGPWTIDFTLDGVPQSVNGNTSPICLGNTAGVYALTNITDVNCTNTATGSQTITINPLPIVTIDTLLGSLQCFGDTMVLQAQPAGTAYQWYFNGVAIAGATSQTYGDINPGIYNVIVTDVNGCSDSAAIGVELVVNPLPVVNLNLLGSNPICDGDTTSIEVTSGGAVSFQWFQNGTAVGSGTTILDITQAGCYNVEVTDTNTCVDTASAPICINVNPLPVVTITADQAAYCLGDTAVLTANGGGLVSYQWYFNGGIIAGEINQVLVTNVAGVYNVMVVDTNGCSDSSLISFTLFQNALPVVTINPLGGNPICFGDTLCLEAISGGAVSYDWLLDGISQGLSSQNICVTDSGLWNVSVTDTNGCVDTASIPVDLIVNPLPNINLNLLGSNPICDGDTTSIEAIVGGAVTYQWYQDGTPVGPNNPIIDITSAGCFNVTVADTNGCIDTASAPICINVNPLPVVTITADQAAYCLGDTAVLTANGGGLVSYQWYFNGAIIAGEINQVLVTNVAGVYNVTVIDTNGCSDSALASYTLFQNALPVVTINSLGGNPICFGDTLCLEAISGGAVSYDWLLDGLSQGLSSQNICVTDSGLWNVSVTDTNGCVDTASIPVDLIVNPLPNINLNLLGSNPICQGDTTSIEAISGGAVSYQWTQDGNAVGTDTSILDVTSAGCYNVSVTDTNGCIDTASAPICIIVNPTPTVSIVAAPSAIMCTGDTVTLTAVGLVGTNYIWYFNGALISGASTDQILITQGGVYNVAVTDSNGCVNDTANARIVVIENPLPIVTITLTGNNPICFGETVTLQANPSGVNYEWTHEDTLIMDSVQVITVGDSGLYNVFVTDTNGCRSKDTAGIVLDVKDLPIVSIQLLSSDTVCEGETVSLSALPAGAVTYQWFNGTTPFGGNTQIISVDTSGVYNVVVTDTNGCSDSATSNINILVDPLPTASIIGDTLLCYVGDTMQLVGTGGSFYQWFFNGINTGLTSDTIIIDSAGSYQLIAENLAGCFDTSALHVVGTDSIDFTVLSSDTGVCPGSPITFSVLNDTLYTFTWSPTGDVGTTTTDNPTDTTTYSVTADNGGCTRTEYIQVDVYPLPVADAGEDTTFCAGDDITLFASGGISYSWSNGDDSSSTVVSPSTSTDFIVTVTDTNGCSSMDTVQVTPLPLVDVTDSLRTCGGDTITLSASGGGTYLWSTGDTTGSIVVVTSVDTTFTVTIENEGCIKTLEANVLLIPDPLIEFESGDTLICISDLIGKIYSVTGDSNLTYSWTGTGFDSLIVMGDSAKVDWSSDTTIDKELVVTAMNEDSCFNTLIFEVNFDERELWFTVVTDDFIDESMVHVIWDASAKDKDRDKLALWRRTILPDTSTWILVDTVGMFDSVYTDGPLATSDSSYQYILETTNICGDPLQTLPHNNIWLRGEANEEQELVTLGWNRYNNWRDGVYEYRIYRKLDEETYLEVYDAVYTDTTITFNNAHDGFIHTYRVLGVENNLERNIVSWSNEVVLDFRHPIHIHNVFSPNGDGVNETFFIDNIWMWPDNQVWIFNRWGNEVFYQRNYDNTWNGENLPTGTYYYIVEVEEFGEKKKYKDALMITR